MPNRGISKKQNETVSVLKITIIKINETEDFQKNQMEKKTEREKKKEKEKKNLIGNLT